MHKRTILVKTTNYCPEFEMIVSVPNDRDDEEYIDELMWKILKNEFVYGVEWDFID